MTHSRKKIKKIPRLRAEHQKDTQMRTEKQKIDVDDKKKLARYTVGTGIQKDT